MQAFTKITSVIAYLPMSNVDTDMIIPKQYLKTIKRTGLGRYLFAELRFDETDQPKKDFVLNQPEFKDAKILLAEENFGCGSSREHAVWSLIDFGIKVIIAPSFADIFYSNCFKNGILPIVLVKKEMEQLKKQKNSEITVNLELHIIKTDSWEIPFTIDADRKEILLKGLDEIGETLSYEEKIIAFEGKQKVKQPWLFSGDINHA